MPSLLVVDSGPFIGWLNARDKHHARAVAFLKARRERLITTWPVITEVCHLTPLSARAGFLRWIGAGGAAVWPIPEEHAAALADLMDRYADLPMDLADASLVWLCHQTDTNLIATIDRTDFAIYRNARNRAFRNVFFS